MGKDENEVQATLTALACRLYDALPIRVNSGKVKVRGGWMTLAPPGTPDMLFLLLDGRCLWLECKTPAGKLSEVQRAMHETLRQRGHTVIVANSVDAFLAAVDSSAGGVILEELCSSYEYSVSAAACNQPPP